MANNGARFFLLLLAVGGTITGPRPAEAACDPLPRQVAGWWPADGSAADVTLAANDGQLLNGATFTPGLLGQGFLLDGVNDRVEIPDAPELRPQQFTLAAWVKLDTVQSQNCFICKQDGSGTIDSLTLWANGTELRGGMFGLAEAVAPGVIVADRFQHVAVTYDASILRLYLDGELIAIAPGLATPIPYDSNPVLIGADDNGVNAFQGLVDGVIDEPMIFGRALSSCEIRALYRANPQGHCKGDVDGDLFPDAQDNCPSIANAGQVDGDVDGVGDPCDCAPADPGVYAQPGDPDRLRFESSENADFCLDPSATGPDTVYDVLRGDLDELPVTSGTSACRSRCLAPPSGLASWWPGDGAATDLVAGNHGALENGAAFRVGWVLDAFDFDGINDRVRTGNLTLGNTFSVAAWVNSDLVNQGAHHRIVETSFSTGVYLGTDAVGTGYKLIVRSPASPFGVASGGKISPGDWQLVVGTYDGATGRLYVDGKQVASDTFVPPGIVTLPLNIGAYFGGGLGWNGRIDEVQLYDRALSATEIQALYEAGSAGPCKLALGGVDAAWTAPWAMDGEIPAPGKGFWYLYRGRNACGIGSYGSGRSSSACD